MILLGCPHRASARARCRSNFQPSPRKQGKVRSQLIVGIRVVLKHISSPAGSSLGVDGFVYEFDLGRIVIGRSPGSDVQLPAETVSGLHATIRLEGSAHMLQDEGSTNGTWLNRQRLPGGRPKILRPGDVIHIAPFVLHVEAAAHVVHSTSPQRTALLARQLVRHMMDDQGTALQPHLRVVHGPEAGRVLTIAQAPARLLVGRATHCDLVLTDGDASREHVEVIRDLEGLVARDLGSKNPTLVNDRPIQERRLRDKDEIMIGGTVLVVLDPIDQRLRAVEVAPDEARTEPPMLDRDPSGSKAIAEPPSMPSHTELERRIQRSGGARADLVIYALAALVFLASIAGLFYLMKGE